MVKNKIIVSLEYDGVLSLKGVRKFIKRLGNRYGCIVLSKRLDRYHNADGNDDMIKHLRECNIKAGRVFFTNNGNKRRWLWLSTVAIHLDNDSEVIGDINRNTNTVAINVSRTGWEDKFERVACLRP